MRSRSLIELALVIAVLVLAAFIVVVRGQMVASCKRVNAVRVVLHEQLLVPAEAARRRDGDTDTADKYKRGIEMLEDVPFTDDSDHPAEVNCADAVSFIGGDDDGR